MLRGLSLKNTVTHPSQKSDEIFLGYADQHAIAQMKGQYPQMRVLQDAQSKAQPQYQLHAIFVPTIDYMKARDKLLYGTKPLAIH